MKDSLLTTNYKDSPYWWDRTQRPILEDIEIPRKVDVAIIGSGYTGLHAAIQTVRNGRETLVLEAEQAGWGGSSRNGGQVSTSIKPNFTELSQRFGNEHARAILQEGTNALEWIGRFVQEEGIDCDFLKVGRFHGAHTYSQYQILKSNLEQNPQNYEKGTQLVPPDKLHEEISSDFYHGGLLYPNHASLDPALYHQRLLECALESGAKIKDRCSVRRIERKPEGFLLHTDSGDVQASKVAIGTSGYTGSVTPWHQRRVIPIGSYIIATEELEEGLVDHLIPKNRIITDTRKLVVYYRASPDRKRILFGGRVSLKETDPNKSFAPLHSKLIEIFPQLSQAKVSHSWMGFVGFSFDHLPHTGVHEDIYYSMGYCGSGVSLSSYLGAKMGQRIAGLPEGKTALDDLPFSTRPLYYGNPWFLAPSILFYKFKDRFFS